MDLVKSFRTTAPSRRLTLVAMVAVLLCALLVAAYVVFLRKPYVVLFTDLRANDAATVVAELEKKKISYQLADDGATIKVPGDLVDRTRLDVMSSELPLKGAVGFELFNKSDMGLTEFAQKINYQRALQGELARTIMTMDMVESARIHLSIPEATIFRGDRLPPKASVTILTRNGAALPAATVLGIQRLVAASVPDMAVNDVVVLDSSGAVVSEAANQVVAGPLTANSLEKQAIEQYYTARIRQALEGGFPGKAIQVRVLADYDPLELAPGAAMRWAPYARSFPLRVTVFSDNTAQEELRAVASAAIGAHVGDTLALSPMAAWSPQDALQGPTVAEPVGPASSRPAPKITPVQAASSSSLLSWAPLAALLVLAAGLATALYRRRRAPRRLNDREKDVYVSRLKQLLEEGEIDVVSSS